MASLKSPQTGSMTLSLVILLELMMLGLLRCTRLRESGPMWSEGGTAQNIS
mgnify:CR=1